METEPCYGKYHPRTTMETSDSHYSEEREVFYYSNFDLFNCNEAEEDFFQFTTFIERVATELGKEWQREAQRLYQPELTSNRVFMTLMELWLSQHPSINTLKTINKTIPFNPKFVTRFHERALS